MNRTLGMITALLVVVGASPAAKGQPLSPYDVGPATSLHAKWSGKTPGTFVLFHNVAKTTKGKRGKPSLIGYQLESVGGGKVVLRRKEAKHQNGKYVARPYSKVEVPQAKGNRPSPSKSSQKSLRVWGKTYTCHVKEWAVGGSLSPSKVQSLLSGSKPGLRVIRLFQSDKVPGGVLQTQFVTGTGAGAVTTTATMVHHGRQNLSAGGPNDRGFPFIGFSPFAWGDINGCHGPFCNTAIVEPPM